MASIWVESLGRTFEHSFGLLEAAIRDCTDDLWGSSMWEVGEGDAAYAARRSTPWSVAWHALEIVDYDLTGGLAQFSPPSPFTDKAHWRDLSLLPSAWSQPELLAYIDELRRRVNDGLSVMTDEKASDTPPGDAPVQGSAVRLVADEHPAAHRRARGADQAVHHHRPVRRETGDSIHCWWGAA